MGIRNWKREIEQLKSPYCVGEEGNGGVVGT